MPEPLHDALELYLRRLCLRTQLGRQERDAIMALPGEMTIVDVEHDFVRLGEKVEHACLIVDGMAARFAQLRNGQRGIVALHLPGDMADLHSVVAPETSWALHATTPTKIARIPHKALRDLSERFPSLALAFWRDCVVDASILAQWTLNLSRKDAAARLAHLFSEMRYRYAAVGALRNGSFPFPITQTTLADALGLTPVHLNRILKRLREQSILVKSLDRIDVGDPEQLAVLGEFDDAYLQGLPTPNASL